MLIIWFHFITCVEIPECHFTFSTRSMSCVALPRVLPDRQHARLISTLNINEDSVLFCSRRAKWSQFVDQLRYLNPTLTTIRTPSCALMITTSERPSTRSMKKNICPHCPIQSPCPSRTTIIFPTPKPCTPCPVSSPCPSSPICPTLAPCSSKLCTPCPQILTTPTTSSCPPQIHCPKCLSSICPTSAPCPATVSSVSCPVCPLLICPTFPTCALPRVCPTIPPCRLCPFSKQKVCSKCPIFKLSPNRPKRICPKLKVCATSRPCNYINTTSSPLINAGLSTENITCPTIQCLFPRRSSKTSLYHLLSFFLGVIVGMLLMLFVFCISYIKKRLSYAPPSNHYENVPLSNM